MKSTPGRRRKARAPRRTARTRFVTLAAALVVVCSVVAGFLAWNHSDDGAEAASGGDDGWAGWGSAQSS
ncbi:hypothetical protein ACFRFS_34265, partial [Streptomyces sp. NPDC056730]